MEAQNHWLHLKVGRLAYVDAAVPAHRAVYVRWTNPSGFPAMVFGPETLLVFGREGVRADSRTAERMADPPWGANPIFPTIRPENLGVKTVVGNVSPRREETETLAPEEEAGGRATLDPRYSPRLYTHLVGLLGSTLGSSAWAGRAASRRLMESKARITDLFMDVHLRQWLNGFQEEGYKIVLLVQVQTGIKRRKRKGPLRLKNAGELAPFAPVAVEKCFRECRA